MQLSLTLHYIVRLSSLNFNFASLVKSQRRILLRFRLNSTFLATSFAVCSTDSVHRKDEERDNLPVAQQSEELETRVNKSLADDTE